jgi:DNA-binding transcriptional LysR family regulator
VAVAEELHFGRAASRLRIAQSPLSQLVRRLEADLGVELLHRTTRRVTLLPAGEALLPRARALLAAVDGAVVDARAAAAGELGRLAVGFTGSMTYALLPRLAKALRDRLPRVQLDLQGELVTATQVARLTEGTLDIALLRPPVDQPGLAIEPLGAERLVVALPRDHPLAALESVPAGRLADEPFVAYATGLRSAVHDAVARTCADHGFVPMVAVEVAETSTLISFVAADAGVALVPASAQLMTLSGAVYRPLSGGAHTVPLAMCWRRDDDAPTLALALEVIRADLDAIRAGRSAFAVPDAPLSTLHQVLF